MTTNVFWPYDLPLDTQDVLYGWKLAPNWFVVALGRSNRLADIRMNADEQATWLARGLPVIRLEDVRGSALPSRRYTLYTCPNVDRLRFFATQPLDLDTGTTSAKPWAQNLLSERLSQLHEAYQPAGEEAVTLRANEGHLDTTLSLINETHHVRKRFLMITEEESEARSDIGRDDAVPVSKSSARQSRLEAIFLLFSRISNYYTKGAYGYSVLPCTTYFSGIAALSAVARQLQLRINQIRTLPAEWRSSRAKNISLEEKSRRYINFYNTVWLIANDLIVGWTTSSVLREHSTHIEHLVNATLQNWLVTRIVAALQWLDDWPVGLKLNAPLSKLFSGIYAGFTTTWLSIIQGLPITTSAVIWGLTCLGFFGASMFISALSDIFALASLHLRMATSISGAIYRAEMAALYALWNLFRGKRWNTLRNRVDSYDYEIDQLFLGTLLFTIALFLLPTIVIYYLFFAVIWLSLLYLQAANDTALSFINSFPLFALMLRFKEPSRLPGGVCFRLKHHSKTSMPFLELTSMPIGLSTLFGKFGKYSPPLAHCSTLAHLDTAQFPTEKILRLGTPQRHL